MKKLPFSIWSLANVGMLVIAAAIWLLQVDHWFPSITDDFTYSANILSYENFFDVSTNKYSGEILSKTKYNYRIEKREPGVFVIRNLFEVHKPSGERVFIAERLYGIDPITTKHVSGYGDKNREGYLFAPHNAGKEFTYWHINYDAPAHMQLRGEEDIEGLHVFRYECDYKADQSKDLDFLPGVPEERGIELDIHLQLWVEPTTGYLVKYEDHATAWYFDKKTKKRIHPWNQFHNKYEETSVSKHVQGAQLVKEKSIWLHRYPLFIISFLTAIVLAVGYNSEQKKRWRPYTATAMVLVMGLSTSYLLHRSLKNAESVYTETIFNRDCDSLRVSLQRELDRGISTLNSLKTKYILKKEISREGYKVLAEQSMKNNELITVMGWIPIVSKANRNHFEMKARQNGFTDFKITELTNSSNRVAAGDRKTYYPLYYIEPSEKNKVALGYDLASDTARKAALEKAASTGEPTATAPVVLVQHLAENNRVFLLFMPVYENELGISDQHIINSFLSAGINPEALMMEAISHANMISNVALTVIDPESKKQEALFTNVFENTPYHFSKKSTLQVANRPWQLQFRATPAFSSIPSAWLPIILILTTVLLSIFIFYILADDKNELQNINLQLASEINEHKLAEARLAIERGKLTVLNSELRASQQELLTQRDHLSKKNEEIANINANLESIIAERTRGLENQNRVISDFVFISSNELKTAVQNILTLIDRSKSTRQDEQQMIILQLEKAVQDLEVIVRSVTLMLQKEES